MTYELNFDDYSSPMVTLISYNAVDVNNSSITKKYVDTKYDI